MGRVVIGLTGGMASGKTTVAGMMAEIGARVFDADSECHRLMQREDIAERVASALGPSVLREGRLDRRAIAGIVFADREALSELEGILHAELVAETRRLINAMAEGDVLVIDAPLLIETGAEGLCDLVLHVDAPKRVRRLRVAGRGWDQAEMGRRERMQMSVQGKRERADASVDNSGDLARTRAQVLLFWREKVLPLLDA